MVKLFVNLAGLALTYGWIRLLLISIYSQQAPVQLLGCVVATAVMGLGARVTLTAGGRSPLRECFTDGSYMSASDPRVHFGLGTAARADRIVIRWPGGGEEVFHDVPADRQVTLRESEATNSPQRHGDTEGMG